MTSFETGRTYWTRSVCDHNCIIRVEVLKRTPKTITTTGGKTFRIFTYDSIEAVKPWGAGALMPILQADDTRELRPDWENAA